MDQIVITNAFLYLAYTFKSNDLDRKNLTIHTFLNNKIFLEDTLKLLLFKVI